MSITYALPLTPVQADRHLEEGRDLAAGFAIDLAQIEGVTKVADFISLFNLAIPGTPFAADRPIDILEMPANPYMQVRNAVGPLDPRSIFGGIIEFPPFTGSGLVRGGGVSADLLWLEPTRVSVGSRIVRYYPGNPEPQVRAIYHGVTWGWENTKTGVFKAYEPSNLIGPAIRRDWGELSVDLEIGAGGTPVAVQMVSPVKPEQEEGFELVESGFWAKRIAWDDSLQVFEPYAAVKVNGVPARAVRTMRDDEGNAFALCIAELLDMPLVLERGFGRLSMAVAEAVVPLDRIEARIMPLTITDYDVSDREAVTLKDEPREDLDRIATHLHLLLDAVAEKPWLKAAVQVQLVGDSVAATGVTVAATEEGDPDPADLPFVPNAIGAFATWLKRTNVIRGEGAPLSILFEIDKQANQVNITPNYLSEPDFADLASAEDWRAELSRYPRAQDKVPAWMKERAAGSRGAGGDAGGADDDGARDESGAGSPDSASEGDAR